MHELLITGEQVRPLQIDFLFPVYRPHPVSLAAPLHFPPFFFILVTKVGSKKFMLVCFKGPAEQKRPGGKG